MMLTLEQKMSKFNFIESLRQEFIDTGEASKELLDYIDERIKNEIDRSIPEYIEAIKEQLEDESV